MRAAAVQRWATVGVFTVLPVAGLVNGAIYAGLLFGLGLIVTGAGWIARGGAAVPDRPLLVLALLLAGWAWMSVAWSVAPGESVHRALQFTAILAGALLLATAPVERGVPVNLFPLMLAALALGGMVLAGDKLAGYPLQHVLSAKAAYPDSKYNRGLDYFSLLVWPMLACGALSGHRRRDLLLACLLAALLAADGRSTTAKLALAAGAIIYAAARAAPRITGRGMLIGTAVLAATLPAWLRLAAQHRTAVAGSIKASGIHRLEIWDYLTARVAERPLLGWGIGAAHDVPIRPGELAHYHYVTGQAVYPHQQWLELWLELGAVGAALALALAVLALRRIGHLPPRTRPFALAACTAALAVTCSNFEITTDSWWAALAGTAFLTRAAARLEAA